MKAKFRKEGRYEVRFYFKGTYKSFYGKTASEAERKLNLYKERHISEHNDFDMTVKEMCFEWLIVTKSRHKSSTEANYMMKFIKHIFPALGNKCFTDVTVGDIHKFIASLSDYSSSYVHDIAVLLKSVFIYANKTYSIKSVFDKVTIPPKKKGKVKVYAQNERSVLIKYLEENLSLTALAILLAIFMGLRIGEICGLTWKDIDFNSKTLFIRRTIQRISCIDGSKKTKVIIGTPKSAKSVRSIPIPDFFIPFLQQFKACDDDFVISGTLQFIEPRTLQNRFKKVIKKAGLRDVNFHSLRHLFATTAIELDTDYRTLSEILGHSSPDITMGLYVHANDERKRECMNRFDKVA